MQNFLRPRRNKGLLSANHAETFETVPVRFDIPYYLSFPYGLP